MLKLGIRDEELGIKREERRKEEFTTELHGGKRSFSEEEEGIIDVTARYGVVS